jgi:hypothetical protein
MPRVWNRIPDDVRRQIIALALEVPELSPRQLAVRFTDEQKYFVSEAPPAFHSEAPFSDAKATSSSACAFAAA